MGSFTVLTLFSGRHLMHVRRALALALAVPALLAGCSDDPEPTPKIPEPTSSSPTPTPTESETAEAESPEEFIRRWQAAADEMAMSGRTAEFLRMSKGCQACATYAEQVSDVFKDGGEVDFGGSEVLAIKEDSVDPPSYIVDVRAAKLRIEIPGESPQVFPAATQRYRMILKPQTDSFTMANYSVI
ncbi:hypothetical protein [Nocardioides sp. zg-1230]|uniref:hypothetical protein n=1 Tax=Nocardioides sp. zg-1230 TaxID=2736601 RepID=UPI0015542F8A|nr:hypothetical protein [Nocardioides sp. zg-1230]NPC41062.1 hypothetical protein [Nocardioides sp. zg-1230]